MKMFCKNHKNKKAEHSIGTDFYLCCSCYVDAGYPPADWHPKCIKRSDEIKKINN